MRRVKVKERHGASGEDGTPLLAPPNYCKPPVVDPWITAGDASLKVRKVRFSLFDGEPSERVSLLEERKVSLPDLGVDTRHSLADGIDLGSWNTFARLDPSLRS